MPPTTTTREFLALAARDALIVVKAVRAAPCKIVLEGGIFGDGELSSRSIGDSVTRIVTALPKGVSRRRRLVEGAVFT